MSGMKGTTNAIFVRFDVNGRVVIPRNMGRDLGIEKGTRALLRREKDGILLTPVTRRYIRSRRGLLKGSGTLELLMSERQRERQLA
jgi:bifunctional DNA-binding transcriptional regulator/antitoxin component of YhaV-PrlF toxin-antitoxin module